MFVNKKIISEPLNNIDYLICYVLDSSDNNWYFIISKMFFKEEITNTQTLNKSIEFITFNKDFKDSIKDDCEMKLFNYEIVTNDLKTGVLFFITNKNIIEIIYNKALNSNEETGLILHIGSNYISEYENDVNNKLVICYYIDEKALHSKYLNLKSWLGPEKTKVMWNKPEVLLESYLEFNESAFKTFGIL